MPKLSMLVGEGPCEVERVYSKTPSEYMLEGWNAFEGRHNLICRSSTQCLTQTWQMDSAVNFSRRGVNLVSASEVGERRVGTTVIHHT
jgi:hypothetical protein